MRCHSPASWGLALPIYIAGFESQQSAFVTSNAERDLAGGFTSLPYPQLDFVLFFNTDYRIFH